jgi:hypothetical protein
MVRQHHPRLQTVFGTAVRALRFAVVVEVKEHARVGRPQGHGRVGAVRRQVLAIEFYRWYVLLVHVFSDCSIMQAGPMRPGKNKILVDSGSLLPSSVK